MNGVVNGDNAKKQENVSIVVSDPTGQVYLATNKAAGNGYWHDITHGDFILPDPNHYQDGDTYTPSDAQMDQIREYVKSTFPTAAEGADGDISWQFVRVGEGENARWDLQGTYSPNYAHVYIYFSGNNAPVDAESNGKKVNGADGAPGTDWYTVGEIKIPYETARKYLTSENSGKLIKGEDGNLPKDIEEAVKAAIEKENNFTPAQAAWAWEALKGFSWSGLKVEQGANGFVNSTKYLTLHLNVFTPSQSPQPPIFTPPINPENPENPETPDTPDVPDVPDVPAAPDDTEDTEDDGEPEVTIEDEATPLAAGPITRAQFVDYLWQHEGQPAPVEDKGLFPDVPEDHQYVQAIAWAKSIDIIEGFTDGNFRPDGLVDVSAVRKILTRYAAYLGREMPALTTLTGDDDAPVFNCGEVLAEFFGEVYVPAADEAEIVA